MRNRDWITRLERVIRENEHRQFSWGEFDCCLFVADCCHAVCGVDPAAEYRGTYSTERGAKLSLRKRHGSIEAAFDAVFSRISGTMVQRGDICLYEAPEGRAMAVRWAGDWWAATQSGVQRIDCLPIIAWRVDA